MMIRLETADFDPDDFKKMKQAELDKNLLVKYFYKPVQDKAATLAEGRAVFKDVLYIDIRVPGDRDSAACRPATQADVNRFSAHYEAFMKRVGGAESGTPLSEWPMVTRSQVEELAFFSVKTVEQLAGIPDSSLQNMRGMQMLKTKAQQWLEANKGKQELEARKAELEGQLADRDAKIADQEARLQALEAALTKAQPAKAKPRGRPKKVEDASAIDSDSQ